MATQRPRSQEPKRRTDSADRGCAHRVPAEPTPAPSGKLGRSCRGLEGPRPQPAHRGAARDASQCGFATTAHSRAPTGSVSGCCAGNRGGTGASISTRSVSGVPVPLPPHLDIKERADGIMHPRLVETPTRYQRPGHQSRGRTERCSSESSPRPSANPGQIGTQPVKYISGATETCLLSVRCAQRLLIHPLSGARAFGGALALTANILRIGLARQGLDQNRSAAQTACAWLPSASTKTGDRLDQPLRLQLPQLRSKAPTVLSTSASECIGFQEATALEEVHATNGMPASRASSTGHGKPVGSAAWPTVRHQCQDGMTKRRG